MSNSEVNQPNSVDPSLSWEWNGTLSKSTGDGTLFSLYLAMQQCALADTISIQSADEQGAPDSATAFLQTINFYRSMPLSASSNDWKHLDTLSDCLAHKSFEDVRLHLQLNPSPLSQVDNKHKIQQDIINNCSLATQKRLAASYTSSLKEDNTLLDEIIENASSFLAA